MEIKTYILTLVGGKKKKDWKLASYSKKNKKKISQLEFKQFWKKILFFFGMSEGKIKKNNEISILFSRRAQFHRIGGPRRPNKIVRAAFNMDPNILYLVKIRENPIPNTLRFS